jgi:hypothetical protein
MVFLPECITVLTNRATNVLLNFASGTTERFTA